MDIFILTLSVLAGLSGITANNRTSVIVDRIEGDYAVVEVAGSNDFHKMLDVAVEDFNGHVSEGMKIAYTEKAGKFHNIIEAKNSAGENCTYYQFRSDDDSVWWLLTEDEIGKIPSFENEYVLTYFDNGTTARNKNCGCPPENDCECEFYDDIFLSIVRK